MNRAVLLPLMLLVGHAAAQTEAPVVGSGLEHNSLTDARRAQIMQQIDEMESSLKNSKSAKIADAEKAFADAAGSERSAYEFFLACTKELKFKDAKESEFREWRDRNEGKFRTHSHMTALVDQLNYLILSIKALRAEDVSTLHPQLRSFLKARVAEHRTLGNDFSVLRGSAADSVFTQLYEIDRYFDIQGWTMSPLDLGAQYNGVLIPHAKDFAPKNVLPLWDERIALEKGLLDPEDTKGAELFQEQVLPQLLWERAKDRLAVGDGVMGCADMLRIIRENPQHPSATAWLQQLKDYLNTPKAAEAPTPSPAP